MDIVTVGIDLAKNVFALHGVDQHGKAVFIKPKVVRGHLPPCQIGMEACYDAHYWASGNKRGQSETQVPPIVNGVAVN